MTTDKTKIIGMYMYIYIYIYAGEQLLRRDVEGIGMWKVEYLGQAVTNIVSMQMFDFHTC